MRHRNVRHAPHHRGAGGRRRAAGEQHAAHSSGGRTEKIYMYGKHALMEALAHAPHAVRKVFLAPQIADADLHGALKRADIIPAALKGGEMDRMVGHDTAHQGVIAVIDPGALMIDFKQFLASPALARPDAGTMLVLLDELTDPHNVGAIIRSAAAFGAAGVLIPPHNQAPVTGTVVKTSAGMAFRVPLVAIGNVNQAVDALARIGFRSYGLVMNGMQDVAAESFDAPALIIVGNEGEGIRQKTLERCDTKLRIPMDARAESLNASVSAAIVLYAWSVRHAAALR